MTTRRKFLGQAIAAALAPALPAPASSFTPTLTGYQVVRIDGAPTEPVTYKGTPIVRDILDDDEGVPAFWLAEFYPSERPDLAGYELDVLDQVYRRLADAPAPDFIITRAHADDQEVNQ